MKLNAKKLFVNGVLGLSVLSANTAVSYGDIMGDYLDHLDVHGGGSTSFNGHNWFFGGGVSFSSPNANFTPFQIVPPSLDTNGCGGFNAVLGGFSYFNPQYLVTFLQQILQAAPGFAFQIALKTFCPQCAGVLNALTSLANQINALGGNACAIDSAVANGVAGWIGKQFSNQLGSSGAASSGDTVGSFLNAVTDATNSFSNMIANLSSKIGGYATSALISEFENEGLVGTALSNSYVHNAWFNYTEFA
ncbi:MAG TPA: hypothetical protein ENO30_06575, partial [Thermodesulfobium narugense]|nr:hypothetical protein [Thermodesulfobium narugense]